MNRLGFQPERVHGLAAASCAENVGEMTLMAHLPMRKSRTAIADAMIRIEQAAGGLDCPLAVELNGNVLASRGALQLGAPGIVPIRRVTSGQWQDIANSGLKPVMTLRSEIIGVQTLKAGDTVGYGSRYRAAGEQRIGIVAGAMQRWLSAHRPERHAGVVDGVRTGTVGTVSMDMLAIDLTPCPQAGIGSPVELWGQRG